MPAGTDAHLPPRDSTLGSLVRIASRASAGERKQRPMTSLQLNVSTSTIVKTKPSSGLYGTLSELIQVAW